MPDNINEQETPVENSETAAPLEEIAQPEMSETERKAREMGWRSKEERQTEGKNNDNYVEPDEYIRRRPLFERIERQGQEVRELKEMQKKWNEHMTEMRKESYNAALRDLQAKRDVAIDESDKAKVYQIERQMADTQARMANDPIARPTVEAPPSEAIEWAQARSRDWYNSNNTENARMMAAANAVDKYLAEEANINGVKINPREHLRRVEEEVKRLFPHRFSGGRAASVGVSTMSKDDAKSTSSLVSKLSPQQRELGEKFYKSNPAYTLEQYAKDLEKMGRLSK